MKSAPEKPEDFAIILKMRREKKQIYFENPQIEEPMPYWKN